MVVIGVVYMDLKEKPNILRELEADEHDLEEEEEDAVVTTANQPRSRAQSSHIKQMAFLAGVDKVYLEDESGRLELDTVGDSSRVKSQDCMVTGMVVAIWGTECKETGLFLVHDYCLSGLPPASRPRPITDQDCISTILPGHRYVALVSGLEMDVTSPRVAVLDILFRHVLSRPEILHIVILGDLFSRGGAAKRRESMKMLQHYLFSLLDQDEKKRVSIMPGPNDPTTSALPQKPILKSLLGYQDQRLESMSNPSLFEINGIRFLGSSGQNIKDILKYPIAQAFSKASESCPALQAATLTLQGRHMVPTAPDTLWSYPSYEEDPFLISESPDVYFVGSQDCFSTKCLQAPNGHSVRCITLPTFSQAPAVVLVDVDTMGCSWVPIDAAAAQ